MGDAVEMAIHCKHCGEKQFVLVDKKAVFSPWPAWVNCVSCGKEFQPAIVVGVIIKGPFRKQD